MDIKNKLIPVRGDTMIMKLTVTRGEKGGGKGRKEGNMYKGPMDKAKGG